MSDQLVWGFYLSKYEAKCFYFYTIWDGKGVENRGCI